MYIELIGYLGSLLVVFSMLMTSVVKLRVINTIGSIIFTGYALAIHSYPTAAMNFCLVIINLVNLGKLLKTKKTYHSLSVSPDDSFVCYFLELYKDDIHVFFPNQLTDFTCAYLVCCGSNPVGILLGTRDGNRIKITLDYATPQYRDCSVGKHLYEYLADQHIAELWMENASEKHLPYLKKMGFVATENRFVKTL